MAALLFGDMKTGFYCSTQHRRAKFQITDLRERSKGRILDVTAAFGKTTVALTTIEAGGRAPREICRYTIPTKGDGKSILFRAVIILEQDDGSSS